MLVSCLMPTFNRRRFVPLAIENFLLQTRADIELVIVDDGPDSVADLIPDDPRIRYLRLDTRHTTGAKRNIACRHAEGEVLVHWDDDDWSAPERVEEQVRLLLDSGADLCGQSSLLFYDLAADRGWRYRYPDRGRPWVAGGTMCYPRELWERHPFPDLRQGEDTQFVWSERGLRVVTLGRDDLYVATIHGANTSAKRTSGRRWSSVPPDTIRAVLGEAAVRYMPGAPAPPRDLTARQEVVTVTTTPTPTRGPTPTPTPSPTGGTRTPVSSSPVGSAHTPTVTVSVPHRGPGALLRASVESILAQTFRDLVCVVVLDGQAPDERDGLDALAGLDDARLVCHVLPESRGRYFADQVVLESTASPYFLVQDSDDRSDPARLERLLTELERTGADVCVSDVVHHDDRRPVAHSTQHGWPRLQDALGPELVHRAGHQGLYRTSALRRVGGWYAGQRIGYDTAILNLLMMTGATVAHVPEPLYHRTIRRGSLSTAADTGWGTPERHGVVRELSELHRRAYAATRGLDPDAASVAVQRLVSEARGTTLVPALAREAADLTARLSVLHSQPPEVLRSQPPAPRVADVRRVLPDVHALLAMHGAANEGWAISPVGAVELDARLRRVRPKRVLDVGSGLSTAVEAVAVAGHGGTVVSLEHDPTHAERTRRLLAAAGVADVAEVVVAPLVHRLHPSGSGPWYDGQPSGRFDFFVVDGPPLRDGGRIAALPALAAHRQRNWELWLFDADRPDEQRCLDAWARHIRFQHTLEPVDDSGVAVLRPTGSGDSPAPVVDRLGISILTGGRPDLLARTLGSFARRWPEQAVAAHVCAFVNGNDPASRDVVEEAGWVDRVITYGPDVVPLGLATSLVVGAVAAHGLVDHVLHLEDDWETRALDGEALVRAVAVLEDPSVGQVRLRHRSDPCLARHMVTGRPITWTPQDDHLRADAHFTFNPALMGAGLVDRIFPAGDEPHAQRRFLETGLAVAQLDPGVFTHSGGSSSRRIALDRSQRVPRRRRRT